MAEDRTLSLGTIFTAQDAGALAFIRKLRQEVQKLNQAMNSGAAKKAVKGVSGLSNVYKDLGRNAAEGYKQNKSYAKSLMAMANASDRSKTAIKSSLAFHEKLRKTVWNQAHAMNAAGKAGSKWAKTLNYSALKAGVLTGKIKQTSTGFVKMMTQAQRASGFMNKQIAKISGGMNRLVAAAKVTASYGLAASAIYAVVDALKSGVGEIIRFDQALRNLQAITGASSDELRAMEKELKKVATNTKYSTVEVADAMVLLAQSGFDAAEAVSAINAVAMLSTGTLTDMATASDLLTTVIRAFGKEAFQATEIADIMANAINKSKLTVDKLRIAFNYVGPAASATGTSLEEVAASMMTLANSGLRASTIGTGLRQIFSRLVAPSSKLREAFAAHNIELEDLNIRTNGFAGVLKNLAKIFIDTESGAVDSAKAFELFGLRGANSVIALVKAIKSGNFQTALKYVYEVGTAAEMAGIQIEGLELKIKNLQDRFKVFFIEIGEAGLEDVIGGFLDAMKAFVSVMTFATKSAMGKFVVTMGTFGTVISGLIISVAALGKGFTWLTGKVGLLFKGFAKSKTGSIILLLTTLVSIYRALSETMGANTERLEDQNIETTSMVKQLGYYKEALKGAYELMVDNKDMTFKYLAVIKRMKEDFPHLKEKIDAANGSFEILYDLMTKAEKEGELTVLKGNAKLLDEYTKAASRATLGESLWQTTLKTSNVLLKKSTNLWKAFITVRKAVSDLLMGVAEKEEESVKSATSFGMDSVSFWWKKWADDAKDALFKAGKASDTYKARVALADAKLMKSAMGWADHAQKYEISYEDITRTITKHLSDLDIEQSTVNRTIAKTIELLKNLRKASEDPIKLTPIDNPFDDLLDGSSSLETTVLIGMQKNLKNQLASFQKNAKDLGLSAVKTSEGIAAIMVNNHKKMIDNLLKDSNELEHLKKERTLAYISVLESAYTRYYKSLRDRAWENYQNDEEEAGNSAEKKLTALGKYNWKIQELRDQEAAAYVTSENYKTEITKEAIVLRAEYESTERLKQASIIRDNLLAIETEYEAKSIKSTENVEVERLNIRTKYAEAEAAEMQAMLELVTSLYGEDSKQYQIALDNKRQAFAQYAQSITDITVNFGELEKERFREMLNDSDKALKLQQITAEEYVRIWDEALRRKLVSHEQHYTRVTAVEATYFENFKIGIMEANSQVQSFGEMWQDIGSQIQEVFADNLMTGWEDYIEGTKSAKEALIDWAVSTLKWLARVIMKQVILNALKGITSSFGNMFGGGGVGAATGNPADMGMLSAGAPRVAGYHKGGIIGSEPTSVRIVDPHIFSNAIKAHGGLGPNERPIIAKKDEGVFTPGQMAALGNMGGTSISVPVTISSGDEQLAWKLRSGIESTVKRIMRQEMR